MDTMNFQGPTFTMLVPTQWLITSSPRFQAIFVAPPTADGVRANLAVAMTPVQDMVTLEAVVVDARKVQETEYPQFQVLAEGPITEKAGEGFRRTYRWVSSDQNLPLQQTQEFFLRGGMLYTLTATREDREAGKVFDEPLEQMLVSFSLI
jgi:hypothetical protein